MVQRKVYQNRKERCPLPALPDIKEDVIVSLTSYKHRLKQIIPTLQSLNNQTRKPDKIVLYVAHEDKEFVYDEIEKYCEVRYCEDTKSHKKFNGFWDFPDAYVVTADDDLIYHNNWLEDLLRAQFYTTRPCVSAHNTFLMNGWGFARATTRMDNKASLRGGIHMYVMSGAGVLRPPKMDLSLLKTAYPFSPFCDEKPLSVLLQYLNIPVMATGFGSDTHHYEAYRNGISLWDMYNCKHQKERWDECKCWIASIYDKIQSKNTTFLYDK